MFSRRPILSGTASSRGIDLPKDAPYIRSVYCRFAPLPFTSLLLLSAFAFAHPGATQVVDSERANTERMNAQQSGSFTPLPPGTPTIDPVPAPAPTSAPAPPAYTPVGIPSPVPSPGSSGQPTPEMPVRATVQPLQPPAVVGTGGGETVPSMEFLGTDAKEVLRYYEQLSKKQLIYDNTVLQAPPVTIVVKSPVSKEEAMKIIETTLLINGISLVPNIGRPDILTVYSGKSPQTGGIPILSDETEIPAADVIVSFFAKLNYSDPQEVAQTLQALLANGPINMWSVVALPKAGSILITDSSTRLRNTLKIIRSIDVKPASVVSEFIPLQRADVKDVYEKLTALFQEDKQGQGSIPGVPNTPGRPPAPQAVGPDGQPLPNNIAGAVTGANSLEISGLTEDSIIAGKIKLVADTRTNRMYVITRPENMGFITALIRGFDENVKFGEPTIRALKYVAAGDMLDVVVDAITDPGQKAEGASGSGTGSGTGTNKNSKNSNNRTGNSNLFSNSSSGSNGGGFGNSGSSGNGATLSESLNTPERDTTPESRIVGNTKILADKRSNAIIVLGNQEVKTKIFSILDKLDVRSPQVMLHTVIGELALTERQKFGVKYILHNGGKSGLKIAGTATTGNGNNNGGSTDGTGTGSSASSGGAVGFGANGDPNINLTALLGGSDITQLLTAGAGGLSGFVTAGNAFNALVDALEATSQFRVISRPSIFTSNNKKAVISSGEEIAIPVSINAGFTGSSVGNSGLVTQSQIQYKTVALQLEILPLINSDREVYLDIVQKVDEESGTTIIDGNSIPKIASRILQTSVMVPDRGTLVLGGLIKQTQSRSLDGLPYLSRIPVIGPLFRTTSKDKARTELIILIRPEVSWSTNEDFQTKERAFDIMQQEPDIESALFPKNLRKKVNSKQLPRTSPMLLREQQRTLDAYAK